MYQSYLFTEEHFYVIVVYSVVELPYRAPIEVTFYPLFLLLHPFSLFKVAKLRRFSMRTQNTNGFQLCKGVGGVKLCMCSNIIV